MSKIRIPELLAPAGSKEALFAAINAKADAVYLSGKEFGARQFAMNFDKQELNDAITMAHLRGVKIYVTVNTLIKDTELEKIADYLIWLYEIGTDAIIVQDIGVIKLARDLVPLLPIHASTQMTIHSEDGVKYASELGIKRVVLARETDLQEIKRISKNLKSYDIELEVFAHGALCYSYSGRCLMSYVLGGRSGNRGACAQPCRKPYSLLIGKKDEYGRPIKLSDIPLKERYLLSTRDLSVYEKLPSIIGHVDSIKIEGRMKSYLYVAIITDIYRKALDDIVKGTFKPSNQDVMNLKLAFNREFTQGYMLGCKTVMARDKPDNRGLYIGDVISYNYKNKKALIQLNTELIIEQGDGIVFVSNDGLKEQGFMVNKTPKILNNILYLDVDDSIDFSKIVSPQSKTTIDCRLPTADCRLPQTADFFKVYLTRKQSLIKKYKNTNSLLQFNDIPICIDIEWLDDNTPVVYSTFKGKNSKEIQVKLIADFSMEYAQNNPITQAIIEKQFRKSKGTPFKVSCVNVQCTKNLFAPIGKINKLRRDLLEQSANALLESYIPKSDSLKKQKNLTFANFLTPSELEISLTPSELKNIEKSIEKIPIKKLNNAPCLAIYIDDIECLKIAVLLKCDRIYFEPKINFKENSKELIEVIQRAILICNENKSSQFIWKLPFITERENLEVVINNIPNFIELGLKEVMVDGITSIFEKFKPTLKITGSQGLNVFNHNTVIQLSSIFDTLTLSPELSIDDIRNLISKLDENKCNLELIVQGNLEVMISKDSLLSSSLSDYCDEIAQNKHFFGLKDDKGKIFPIYEDIESKTHLFNAVELSLIDYMPLLFDMGLNTLVIDARNRSRLYVKEILTMYQDAMRWTLNKDENLENHLHMLKTQVKNISIGGITTSGFKKKKNL